LPDAEQDQNRDGGRGIAHPVGPFDSEQGEKGIDRPVFGEQIPPADGGAHAGADQGGQVNKGAVPADAAHFFVQQEGDEQGNDQAGGNGKNHVSEGGAEGSPKIGVAKDLPEIVKPHPFG